MILAFTGAGISRASGIPTFAEQEGLRNYLERDFANRYPKQYRKVIEKMQAQCDAARPNDAHLALKEYGVPIITMNVDGLHQRAGSEHVLAIHGTLPNIVLYGDPAPLYREANEWVGRLREGDFFLIIGTSFYTTISAQLRIMALTAGVDAFLINEDAEHRVRQFLERAETDHCSFEEFMHREQNG